MTKPTGLKPLLIPLAAVLLLSAFWGIQRQRAGKVETLPRSSEQPLFEPHDKPMTIYLKAVEMESGRPFNLTATIRQSKSRFNQMKQAVLAFLKGPRTGKVQVPVPEGMGLNEFYFTPQGLAVVDLAASQVKRENFGFFEEAVFVRGLIEVLSRNFFEVKQVKILVDGVDSPQIAGHYALGTSDAAVPAAGLASPH